jgi:hypothetical protein
MGKHYFKFLLQDDFNRNIFEKYAKG